MLQIRNRRRRSTYGFDQRKVSLACSSIFTGSCGDGWTQRYLRMNQTSMNDGAAMIHAHFLHCSGFALTTIAIVWNMERIQLMERKEKQQIKVAEITASWGSPLQKQAGEAALRALLLAWKEFYSEKHQRNYIEIAFPPFPSSRPAQEMEARQS